MDGTVDADLITLEEAGLIEDTKRPIFRLLLIMGAILLMILPFVTTFNEFLTRIVETAGLDAFLADWIVPFEARMIAEDLEANNGNRSLVAKRLGLSRQGLLNKMYKFGLSDR